MSATKKIAVLVGSLRKASFTRKVAQAAMELTPAGLEPAIVEIGQLPLYNEDLEGASAPAAWTSFRQAVKATDALLFMTPEYNRSVPGCLKNAIDVGSRPYGHSVWGGKPGAVISVSPGAIAGFGANHHLRQCFVFLDILPLQQPEAYIGGASKLFDAEGKLANADTKEFLRKYMDAFARWIERVG
jgi:chromate reductase, NAD(P)H dehydrogenase (quinone)